MNLPRSLLSSRPVPVVTHAPPHTLLTHIPPTPRHATPRPHTCAHRYTTPVFTCLNRFSVKSTHFPLFCHSLTDSFFSLSFCLARQTRFRVCFSFRKSHRLCFFQRYVSFIGAVPMLGGRSLSVYKRFTLFSDDWPTQESNTTVCRDN